MSASSSAEAAAAETDGKDHNVSLGASPSLQMPKVQVTPMQNYWQGCIGFDFFFFFFFFFSGSHVQAVLPHGA
jgi:hypothetical protein